ncbi:MAG: orotate phosphoribosyltransferase [Candidatus Hadarchaeales archaeon]
MLAAELFRHGCVLFGEFRLSSGALSPYYIDLRRVPSFPRLLQTVVEAYIRKIREERIKFDRIAGIATAGIPIASVLAYRLEKPFLYVRKEEKTHGTGKRVEGVVEAGERVLLVDDVVTTGSNLLLAASALREQGARVEDVLVLIDREQGGGAELERNGLKLHSCLKVTELVSELREAGLVEDDRVRQVLDYVRGFRNV